MKKKIKVVSTDIHDGFFYEFKEMLSEFKDMNFLEIIGMFTLIVFILAILYILYCFLWLLAH